MIKCKVPLTKENKQIKKFCVLGPILIRTRLSVSILFFYQCLIFALELSSVYDCLKILFPQLTK